MVAFSGPRLPTPGPAPPGPDFELPLTRLPRRALSQDHVDRVDRLERCSGGVRPDRRTRAMSHGPLRLSPLREERVAASGSSSMTSWARVDALGAGPPPVVHNVPAYERPQAYAAALRELPALQRPPRARGNPSRGARGAFRNPLDAAVQREFLGEGLDLSEAVASRRDAGWAVKQRHVQKSDVGHCCHACRQPLRDLSEEVTVWTGAAIYRRFHPACAASYVLRAGGPGASSPTACGSGAGALADVVEEYADGWRAPRERTVRAARDWLLSQDPNAYPSLRGDLFTTVTVTDENGQKKAVPGLSPSQIKLLRAQHQWSPEQEGDAAEEPAGCDCEGGANMDVGFDCAVCFSMCEADGDACVRLPCHPQHVFHEACVLPWLRKASLCPTCRRDIRPLLTSKRAVPM